MPSAATPVAPGPVTDTNPLNHPTRPGASCRTAAHGIAGDAAETGDRDAEADPANEAPDRGPAPTSGDTAGGASGPGGNRLADRPGRPPIARINIALFGIGVATFTLLFSTQALLPEIAAAFGARADQASWTVSGATLGLAAAVLPLSLLSERIGRRRMMTLSITAALLLGLVIPFAPGLDSLIALRALQGAALAGIPASAVAYLSEELDKRTMIGAVGLFIAGNSIGGMLGRVLGGWAAEVWDWRAALLAVTGLALAGAVLYATLLPNARNFTPAVLPPRIALATLTTHLRNALLVRLYGIGMLLMAAFSAVYTAIAFRLTEDPFGLSAGLAGSVFLIYLVGTCSSSVTGPTTTRLGRRGALYAAMVTLGAGLVLSLAEHLAAVLLGLVLITAGFFLGHAVASSAVGRTVTMARAQASALYQVAYYGGASAGGALGTVTYHQAAWPGTVAFALAALAGAAVITLYATVRAVAGVRGGSRLVRRGGPDRSGPQPVAAGSR